MTGGKSSRAQKSNKMFQVRIKKRLARKARQKAEEEARQKAEEEARQKAEEEACQKRQKIELLKWLIPFAAHSRWLSLQVIANEVKTDGNEQLQNLVQRFLNKDITEKSIILDLAPHFCKRYGVDTLDFKHYDPDSPYPPPTKNPYYRDDEIVREENYTTSEEESCSE